MNTEKFKYSSGTWNFEGENQNVNLVLCFGARDLLTEENYNTVKGKYPNAEISMCSTAGEIYDETVSDNTISGVAIELEKTKIKTIQVNISNFKDSNVCGKHISNALNTDDLQHILVLSDGGLVNGSELVKGLNSVKTKNIAITGGLAGDGTNFENNGQEVWYGVDGNALLSSSLHIEDGEYLVAWEDNRYLSTGHPGSYTYGLSLHEGMDIYSHEQASPLSLNPYQGPHGGSYSFRAKLSKSDEAIMMNFHQYDGPYRQYIQMVDYNLNIMGNDLGMEVDSNGEDQKYSALCSLDNNFFLAYSSLTDMGSYAIFLQKYDDQGQEEWASPINIVEASTQDHLVKAIIPNPNFINFNI